VRLDFDPAANENVSLGGIYGFSNDSASASRVGPATKFSQSALTAGISQVFNGSRQVGVGTRAYTVSANLNERIHGASTRSENLVWSSLSLQASSARPQTNPLPVLALVFGLSLLIYFRHGRRRLQLAMATIAKQNPELKAPIPVSRQSLLSMPGRTTSGKFDRDELGA
jgi:hypothetical protein